MLLSQLNRREVPFLGGNRFKRAFCSCQNRRFYMKQIRNIAEVKTAANRNYKSTIFILYIGFVFWYDEEEKFKSLWGKATIYSGTLLCDFL